MSTISSTFLITFCVVCVFMIKRLIEQSLIQFLRFVRCIVDDTVRIEDSPSRQSKRFSVEAFKFVGDFPFVYLHCSVVVCKTNDSESRCSKGCIPGLNVNPPYSVMEKLKEHSQHRTKREVQYEDPNYLITKGPISLNEDTMNDGPDISLKGPQQDRSKMVENTEPEEKREGKAFMLD